MGPADRERLLRWYRANRRDLPWRRTNDPYAIWVSEVMLQQTRVDVVIPYYEKWMRRLPTIGQLARAKEDDVLALWSGLGYYRRARHMQQAAKDSPKGLPTHAEGLRGVKGIGAYTAAAVASIAHGEPVACVDGNVDRVVRRMLALRAQTAAARRKVEKRAQGWIDHAAPGDWNQAMMDLGATVCLPRNPKCGECPVAAACLARQRGLTTSIPAAKKAGKVSVQKVQLAFVVRRGRVLLVRQKEAGGGKLLGGLWALPGGTLAPANRTGLAEEVARQAGHHVKLLRKATRLSHKFSHVTWDMHVHAADATDGGGGARAPSRGTHETKWVPVGSVRRREVPVSEAARKAVLAAYDELSA